MTDNARKLIEQWGQDLVADVLAALESHDKVATGRLYLSVRHEVVEALDELRVLVYEEDYGKHVDSGRAPGGMPPLDRIREWCRVRGIPARAAWPIARRIARIGTQPTNYFRAPLSVRLALLREELPPALAEDMRGRLRQLAEKMNEK